MFCKLVCPIVSLEAGGGNILVLARKLKPETDWKKIWRKYGRSTWASDKPRALGSILFLCRLCQTWSISGHECTDKSLNHEILQFTLYLFFCDKFSFKILASGGSLLNHSLPIQIIWVIAKILRHIVFWWNLSFLVLQVEAPAFLQEVGSLLVGVGQNQGAWGSDNLVKLIFSSAQAQIKWSGIKLPVLSLRFKIFISKS